MSSLISLPVRYLFALFHSSITIALWNCQYLAFYISSTVKSKMKRTNLLLWSELYYILIVILSVNLRLITVDVRLNQVLRACLQRLNTATTICGKEKHIICF